MKAIKIDEVNTLKMVDIDGTEIGLARIIEFEVG